MEQLKICISGSNAYNAIWKDCSVSVYNSIIAVRTRIKTSEMKFLAIAVSRQKMGWVIIILVDVYNYQYFEMAD